jgi:F0F1-type ATP synthase epsilon subunit
VPDKSDKNQPPKNPRDLEIRVSIRTRRKVLFEGPVFSLTSFNSLGEFSVLPQHANFVSLVKNSVVLDKGTPREKVFKLESGLINVEDSGVYVYIGI